MTLLAFFRGGGVAAALCLPARVSEDSALGPADKSSVDSVLGTRTEIGMVRIGSSHWKLEMVDVKLSKAFIIVQTENEYSRKNKELRINILSSYRVSLHSEMVGAHLLGHRPAASVGKHLLKEFQHFADFDLVC
jgi:hypothetical protein